MIHFASKCFQAAYASGRMLVLDEEFFGLKSHFKPLSNSCPYQDLLKTETIFQWPYNMTEKGTYSLDHLKRSQTFGGSDCTHLITTVIIKRIHNQ